MLRILKLELQSVLADCIGDIQLPTCKAHAPSWRRDMIAMEDTANAGPHGIGHIPNLAP